MGAGCGVAQAFTEDRRSCRIEFCPPTGRARVALAMQNPQNASMSLSTILLILAFIAFVLAAIGWGYRKTNLLGIGLALWVLSILITEVHFG